VPLPAVLIVPVMAVAMAGEKTHVHQPCSSRSYGQPVRARRLLPATASTSTVAAELGSGALKRKQNIVLKHAANNAPNDD